MRRWTSYSLWLTKEPEFCPEVYSLHTSWPCQFLEADTPNLGFEYIIPKPRFNLDTVINDYGKELVLLCISSGMCIVNGRTIGDKDGMFTRVHKTGNSVTDYVIICLECLSDMKSFCVDEHMPESDQRPLQCSLICEAKSQAVASGLNELRHTYCKWNSVD